MSSAKRWFWIVDALVVVLFVVIGREDHGYSSGISDYLRVSAPFLIGLGVTIVAVRAWRWPLDWRTGAVVAVGTVVVGMLLRHFVWDDGTAGTFVIVTTAFLVAGMVGWRLVVAGVDKVLAARRTSAA
jgi:ribose/xylose/arabinose/galactoside ABC-type transport system permease subunit